MSSIAAGGNEPPPDHVNWVFYKELYLDVLENRSKSDSDYVRNVRIVLDRFTSRCRLLMVKLNELNQLHIAHYVSLRKQDVWQKRPLSNKTINNEIQIINSCLSYAGPREMRGPGRKNLGWINEPPWHELLPVESKIPRTVTPDDFPKLLRAISHARTPHHTICDPFLFWSCAFVLMFLTALRRSALLNVPRPKDDVLIGQRELFLPAYLSKTGHEQFISLGDKNSAVVELLKTLPSRPGEPFLPWKSPRHGQHMTAGYFNDIFRTLQRNAEIPEEERILPKHFRSGSGTEIAASLSMAIAKKRLGHSPNSTTFEKHYQGRTTEKDVDASNYLASLIMPYVEASLKPQLKVIG